MPLSIRLLPESIDRLSVVLGIGTAAVVFGQGAALPILPVFALGFGVGTIGLAWAVAGYAIGRLAVTIPTGIFEGRFSARRVLTGGCLITALGVLGCGAAPSFTMLVLFRTMAGVGSGIYMTSAILMIVRTSAPEVRGRRIGFNQTALLATVTVAPALGGGLGELIGLRGSFVVSGLLSLAGAAVVWMCLPATDGSRNSRQAQDKPAVTPPPRVTLAPKVASFRLWVPLALAGFVNLMLFATRSGARQTILPLIATEEFGMSVGALGALFTMMSVVSLMVLPLSAALSDRAGRVQVLVPATLLASIGLLLVARSGGRAQLWVSAGLMSAGIALGGPAPAAWVADLSPPSRQGLMISGFRTAGDAGSVLGPLLLGWVAAASSLRGAMLTQCIGLAGLGVLLIGWWVSLTTRRGH